MIKEENVKLNKTARKEEILAYVTCKDYIFPNKECLIGDSALANCPDIYAKDFSIGAEVVICECADTFARIQKFKTGNAFKNKPCINKNKKSLYLKHKFLNEEYKAYITEEEEYFYQLEQLLTDKLINQKHKHYRACKEMNLIVMSCFKDKKFIIDEEIFEFCEILMKIHNTHDNPYNAIYIVLGDRTLKIDNKFVYSVLSDLRIKKNDLEIEK